MKSLLQLHLSVLRNVAQYCSVDTARDEITLTRRWEDEGDSFLTITLPKLGKALEKGLDQGKWPAQDVNSLWIHVRGLPAFMRGFLSRIFAGDGTLLEEPDVTSIWALRQMCYLTHKVERECSPERIESAFRAFKQCEEQLVGIEDRIDPRRMKTLQSAFDRLFRDVLVACDSVIANYELVPRHGPGAVAERLSQKEKRSFHYWTDRLDDVFPSWRYTSNLPVWRIGVSVPMEQEIPVRVITVPKTQSTPRIIAIEPSAMQYAQQGLKRELYERIERGSLGKILGFTDQTRNQNMARTASQDQSLSTLDLSEASDRVSYYLVKMLFSKYSHTWDFIDATRSRSADVSGFGVIQLQKFASMGSALTFPVEAMVFTAIALAGMEEQVGHQLSVRKLPGQLSVYGDDIIIPSTATANVIDWLEHFGAKVNRSKSFWTGKFRESCGAEFYNGHDVSVVRLRHDLPRSRSDAAEFAALVDFRNRCYFAGLWSVVRDLDCELETHLKIPYAKAHSITDLPGYIARASALRYYFPRTRWNPNLHVMEARVPVLKVHSDSYELEGQAGLLEWFHNALRQGDLVDRFASKERATAFSIYSRWHSAYQG